MDSDIVSSIYIIVCGEYCKIGFARDVDKRLSVIQVCNPLPVALYYKQAVPRRIVRQIEDFIHYKLRLYHVRGEWYEYRPEFYKELILSYFPELKGNNHGSIENSNQPAIDGSIDLCDQCSNPSPDL